MTVEIDGRLPHRWVASTFIYLRRPKRTRGASRLRAEGTKTTHRGRVRFWWGIDAPRLHHGWISGGRFSTRHQVRFTYSLRHMKQVVKQSSKGVLAADYPVEDKIEIKP